MFCNSFTLKRKSGKKGIDRPEYLSELIAELETCGNQGQL